MLSRKKIVSGYSSVYKSKHQTKSKVQTISHDNKDKGAARFASMYSYCWTLQNLASLLFKNCHILLITVHLPATWFVSFAEKSSSRKQQLNDPVSQT